MTNFITITQRIACDNPWHKRSMPNASKRCHECTPLNAHLGNIIDQYLHAAQGYFYGRQDNGFDVDPERLQEWLDYCRMWNIQNNWLPSFYCMFPRLWRTWLAGIEYFDVHVD